MELLKMNLAILFKSFYLNSNINILLDARMPISLVMVQLCVLVYILEVSLPVIAVIRMTQLQELITLLVQFFQYQQ